MPCKILVYLFFLCIPPLSAQNFSSAEQRALEYMSVLSAATDLVVSGEPILFDVVEASESLYEMLYVAHDSLGVAAECLAMMQLQAFFSLSSDERLDFEGIERVLVKLGKSESVYCNAFIVCAGTFAVHSMECGNTSKTIAACQRGLRAHKKVYGQGTVTAYGELLTRLIFLAYFEAKEWPSAARYGKELLSQLEQTGQLGSEDYVEVLQLWLSSLQLAGDWEEADEAFGGLKPWLSNDEASRVEMLLSWVEVRMARGHFEEAEPLIDEAMDLAQASGRFEVASLWPEVLFVSAELCKALGSEETLSARVYEALDYFEGVEEVEAEEIARWIDFAASLSSAEAMKRIVDLLERGLPSDDVSLWAALCRGKSLLGDFSGSDGAAARVDWLLSSLTAEEISALSESLLPMYVARNDFAKIAAFWNEHLLWAESQWGKDSRIYAELSELRASYELLAGNHHQALAMLESCLEMNVDEALYETIVADMASALSEVGDYMKSNLYAGHVLEKTVSAEKQYEMLLLMVSNLICELDIRLTDATESGTAQTDSLRMCIKKYANDLVSHSMQIFGDVHPNTLTARISQATACLLCGEKERMLELVQGLEQAIRTHILNERQQTQLLAQLAYFYLCANQCTKAEELIPRVALSESQMLPAEKEYVLLLLSETAFKQGNVKEAQALYQQLTDLLTSQTKSRLATLTAAARQLFWRRTRNILMNAGKIAALDTSTSNFAGVVYNLNLFAKKLLLDTEEVFRQAVLNSGDAAAVANLNQLFSLRTEWAKNAKMNSEEFASKLKYADSLEIHLLELVGFQAGMMDSPSWPQVQAALPDSAIAVELTEFMAVDEKAHYGAVLLKRDWPAPCFRDLGEKNVVEKTLVDESFTPEGGWAAWSFLVPFLPELRTIYFSPAGIFYKIPVEYYPLKEMENFSMHFTVNRLSSTAELLKTRSEAGEQVVVFGGLFYDASVDVLSEDAKLHPRQGGSVPTRGVTKPLSFLPGTEKEADFISQEMTKSGQKVQLLKGNSGTEAAFKALSGQRNRLIHIGTHGFLQANAMAGGSLPTIFSKNTMEDVALLQSGLYFAGANNAQKGVELPGDVDDGILTSLEIASLDLRGTELVVLSACETGLGQITGDGVFGLQRGFKKAGANAILMSLWKVNDQATQQLMRAFYRHLLSGSTLQQALMQAQTELRQTPTFANPFFWASFILLDGI